MNAPVTDTGLRRVVRLVALLNLGYFGIEFAPAFAIGSVSLFADSIDFLEDASVNFLILAALDWGAKHRARVGMGLAVILLIPGLATLSGGTSSAFRCRLRPWRSRLPGLGRLLSICPAPSCWRATGRKAEALPARPSCRHGTTLSLTSPLSQRDW
jgi:hypothetical protein